MTRYIAFDTETFLIRPANQAPAIVCLQYAEVYQSALGWAVSPGTVLSDRDGLIWLVGILRDPDVVIIGAETSYDVLVSITSADTTLRALAPELGLDPAEPGADLLQLWTAAYDAGRVTDILVRQKLIDLARGCYRYERADDGETIVGANKYNLADLARRVAGIEIPEENKKCSVCKNEGCPHCPWRLRYGSLYGIPVDRWPSEALEYARLDAVATAQVWLGQWRESIRISQNYPGVSVADVLAEEWEESRSALWLKAMSAYGLRTDSVQVERFRVRVQAEYDQISDDLVRWGLLRRTYKQDLPAIRSWIERNGLTWAFTKSEPPVFTLERSAYERAIVHRPDLPILVQLARGDYADPDLLASGLTFCQETKDTKAAAALVTEAWPEVPLTDGCKACKKGNCQKHSEREYGGPKLDKDTLLEAADRMRSRAALEPDPARRSYLDGKAEIIAAYAELSHLSKQISTDIPILLDGAIRPIHTRYESMQETQRTGSSKPNVQNQPRGSDLHAGARECFVPRDGYVFVDSDYEMGELYTLAQTCYWILGYSVLGDALKAGLDPHLIVAAQILGKPYAWCLEHIKDPEVKNARNCGKAVNFGRPGGLSAKTMKSYGVKSYGVSKTVEEWQAIIDIWNATYTEMPAYFRFVSGQESYPRSGRFNIRYPNGGFRANTTYCSGCNTYYQRFLAKVAKRAGWYLFKACYTERSNVMYGSRPVLFVHDQFFTETIDNENAHSVALEQARLMNLAAAELMPDCPTKTSPILARRWSKKADETTDGAKLADGGRLVPWEDKRISA